MKKLMSILGAISISSAAALTVASCTGKDKGSYEDYDWKIDEPYSSNSSLVSINGEFEERELDIKNEGEVMDYHNISTSFKNSKGLQKQRVTGVPLNSSWLPNGNVRKDFYESGNPGLDYESINSILDWSPEKDLDSAYNKSNIDLQNSSKIMKSVNTQDEKVKSMMMGLQQKSTSAEHTIVGDNRFKNHNFNNWSSVDYYISWAGSADEGIIIPPPADSTEYAHKNGTKIFGNVFLDGYHGLTSPMLEDFFKKDSSGNYLIVDKLILIANYYGFDGWFMNSEPNGAGANGTIADEYKIIEMIKQFKEKVNDQKLNLEIVGYRAGGSLVIPENSDGKDDDFKLNIGMANESDMFLQDFYTYAEQSKEFLKDKGDKKYDIFNMYNAGGWINGKIYLDKDKLGKREIKELTHDGEMKFEGDGKQTLNNLNYEIKGNQAENSIAIFTANTPYDLANQEADKIFGQDNSSAKDKYVTMFANYLDDRLYNGYNRQVSNEDKGTTRWNEESFTSDLSSGVNDVHMENTVLNGDFPSFKTNFSTGQGYKFVNSNGDTIEDYNWNNRRLGDTQLTYKWQIFNSDSNGLLTKNSSSNLTGYYDYDEVYRKGNSISFGNVDFSSKDAKVSSANFDGSKLFNLFGSDFDSSGNDEVKLVVKSFDNEDKLNNKIFDYNLALTTEYDEIILIEPKTTKNIELKNEWEELTFQIPSLSKIKRIGLKTSNKNGSNQSAKLTIGEFDLIRNANRVEEVKNSSKISNAISQYVINRKSAELKNLRLSLDDDNFKNIYAYEFYVKVGKEYKIIGQTTAKDYYLKNININEKEIYVLASYKDGSQQKIKLKI